MSQFTEAIRTQRAQLIARFDALLRLRNIDPETLDRDTHYAIFKLAGLVAQEFPNAEVKYHWTRELITYHLPTPWETQQDPHWLVECPRLEAPYDEVLPAPDAILLVSSSATMLSVRRQFRVDDIIAAVNIEAEVPPEDIVLLRAIGKIEDVLEPGYVRTTSTC
jgi:hypothetical protein